MPIEVYLKVFQAKFVQKILYKLLMQLEDESLTRTVWIKNDPNERTGLKGLYFSKGFSKEILYKLVWKRPCVLEKSTTPVIFYRKKSVS